MKTDVVVRLFGNDAADALCIYGKILKRFNLKAVVGGIWHKDAVRLIIEGDEKDIMRFDTFVNGNEPDYTTNDILNDKRWDLIYREIKGDIDVPAWMDAEFDDED